MSRVKFLFVCNDQTVTNRVKQSLIKPLRIIGQLSLPDFRQGRGLRRLKNTDFLISSAKVIQANKQDMSWLWNRLSPTKLFGIDINPTNQYCPSWSAYNCKIAASPDFISLAGYCPMLNACSTDPSTVYTVLKQLNQMMHKLKQEFLIIIFDLAIYRVAKKVQWSTPEEFKRTIIGLDGFHIFTNFLGALGTMHQSSGLKKSYRQQMSSHKLQRSDNGWKAL